MILEGSRISASCGEGSFSGTAEQMLLSGNWVLAASDPRCSARQVWMVRL